MTDYNKPDIMRTEDDTDVDLWRAIWELLLSLVAVIERHKLHKLLRFTTKEARDRMKQRPNGD